MGYEIAEQLGWRVPDVILYPAGGGVGLIGIHKAMLEMQELGWIGDRAAAAGRRPGRPAARRSCDAFDAGLDESTLVEGTHTLAFGINVPKALGDFLVLQAVRESGGTAVAVSDEAILAELRPLAAGEGSWICPEGAACLVAVRELRERGWIAEHEQVVVLNTGTGLKYPETVHGRRTGAAARRPGARTGLTRRSARGVWAGVVRWLRRALALRLETR